MVQGAVPEHQLSAVYDPMVNLILRGSKTMTVGDQTLRYDPATYFVMSVDLPAIGTVHADKNGAPYLAISLTLDTQILAQLLADLPESPAERTVHAGFCVATVTPELMDAWVRMMRLMRTPNDIPALSPAYEREILYRVLTGPQGALLREVATPESAMSRVSKAIRRIRRDLNKELRIATLADEAKMSVSAFHRQFKAVTALSPLQFQKRIRLLQARGLLVSGGLSVTAAAFKVGYESTTQFSREYSRAFGLSPYKDADRIRSMGLT
jgi:AraC-like DNA-binding protein